MPHIKTSSGIEWHYTIEGKGEVLLFLHGWGVDRRVWKQQVKFFKEIYQVVNVDLPGHGESTFKKVSLTQMAEDIVFLIKKLKLNKVTIIGSSLGGLVGLKTYSLAPELFKRMVFVGSMPKFARSDDYPYGLDIEKMRKLEGQLDDSYPAVVDIFFRSLFTKQERATRRYKWLQKFRQTDAKPIKQALLEYLDILECEDLRDTLAKVEVPINFINGTGDEICTPESVNYLKQVIPEASFYDFEECGHFPFLSRPYEFNEVLLKFLRSEK